MTAIPADLLAAFRRGVVIPAMPLALTEDRRFDTRRQRALLRYYIDAGAGGVAVGVHSTQFEIRDPEIGLFEPVLAFAAEAIEAHERLRGRRVLRIAGVCGRTGQALREASFASRTGYHACLLSLAAFKEADVETLITHCRRVADVMPVVGFYLQPSVGGRVLPFEFWRAFADIPNVVGIKIAPFNRYQTFDVVRAICEAGRTEAVTLYTGNDDAIVHDLLTEFHMGAGGARVRIRGGLLGHWCVWTQRAVDLLNEIHALADANAAVPQELLSRAAQVTDANAAFFDAANRFAGCIPGLHEVLRRQGLFAGTWCLNRHETLSPGQGAEIDRVYAAYPHLNDDAFVRSHLDAWLA